MTDERTSFETTRGRLDEILAAVRQKDTSLEQSLELLEEGVRLANMCNEQIDQTSWRSADPYEESEQPESDSLADAAADEQAEAHEQDAPTAVEEPDDERS